MPFLNPKSVNLAIQTTLAFLEGYMHLFSTECKFSQSNNKVLPSKQFSLFNNARFITGVKA
jgi:hypothetical protein